MLESTKLCQHFIVMSFLCFVLFFIENLTRPDSALRLCLYWQVCTMTFLMRANKGMEVILMQVPMHVLNLIHMLMKMLMLMIWQVLTLTKVKGIQRVLLDNVPICFDI